MRRLLVATTNRGKLAELVPLLSGLGWQAVDLGQFPGVPEAVEDGATLQENARRKARHYAEHTGLAALADDSGLEVAALGGEPGVRSARYAGEHADDAANNALLLQRLAGVADRRARFVCALCVWDGGRPLAEVTGRCEGRLLEAPRGEGGFGYDPLFVPDDGAAGGRTFAELSRAEKGSLSHRGRALAALALALSPAAGGAAP